LRRPLRRCEQYGLPCCRIIANKILRGAALSLEEVDPHWHLKERPDVDDVYVRIRNPLPAPVGGGRPAATPSSDPRPTDEAPRGGGARGGRVIAVAGGSSRQHPAPALSLGDVGGHRFYGSGGSSGAPWTRRSGLSGENGRAASSLTSATYCGGGGSGQGLEYAAHSQWPGGQEDRQGQGCRPWKRPLMDQVPHDVN
jgi:hypothetical protein